MALSSLVGTPPECFSGGNAHVGAEGVIGGTMDLSAGLLADYQEMVHEPIAFPLKREAAPPQKSETAWPKSHRRAEPASGVRSLRLSRK